MRHEPNELMTDEVTERLRRIYFHNFIL